jgi:protein-L-isoaspartate(D-aspartate) O-methyltransferase
VRTILPILLIAATAAADEFDRNRSSMVSRQLRARDITNQVVLAAMGKVPRHEFVKTSDREEAYADQPLPIGYGQTISQPYIVALMTQLLDLKPGQRALEIGTGSGYQAAVLAEIIDDVFTIEIVEPLGQSAAERLKRLGYSKIRVKVADGYFGWAEHGPFDAIIVTAAADHVPPPLLEQLKPGGRMAIPVGGTWQTQNLLLVTKNADGKVRTENIAAVAFVPLTRAKAK